MTMLTVFELCCATNISVQFS